MVLLAVFAVAEGVNGIFFRDNDLEVHRNYGLAFLEGDPYGNSGVHYLPSRMMINASTAWLPYRLNRAVIYLAALAALAWTLVTWDRLANQQRLNRGDLAFASIVFTLAITATYIQRDLDDCGLQILLLFFLTAAAANLEAGRALRCGFWLGLAAVYKLTPLLFLPYVCYKRQWRAAASMVAFIIGLALAPALWLGWDANVRAHERWWNATRTVLGTADPVENTLEPPNQRNQSLVLALARLAQTYPPGHALYLENPLFFQFGNLSAAAAKRFVQGFLLLLAAVLAWRFRKTCNLSGPGDAALREWAAVTLLAAILSPLCWQQHLVLVLPAVYLVVRAGLEPGGLSPWQRRLGWLAAIVMLFAGQRDLLGQGFFMALMSYKVHTWAALVALVLVLAMRSSDAS